MCVCVCVCLCLCVFLMIFGGFFVLSLGCRELSWSLCFRLFVLRAEHVPGCRLHDPSGKECLGL